MTFRYQLLNNSLSLAFKLAKFTCFFPPNATVWMLSVIRVCRFAAQTENVYQRSQWVKVNSQQWSCTAGARRERRSVYCLICILVIWAEREQLPGCKPYEEVSTIYLRAEAKERQTRSSSLPQVNCLYVG